ncbi:class I SAM-dependent methyltransferase [Streptomyces xiamenensis]|uniref:class I SAM-dependent methyltransferase n=1 Tax=Streptomyces xiamenensis TaxID=408015 RepID=UPI0037D0E5C5
MRDTYWDDAAATFDEEPDHGLRDPAVRAAWEARLRTWLPGRPSRVLDLGCGTGSLSELALEHGHTVTAIDRSEPMVRLARTKLAGGAATLAVGDAAHPPVRARAFDVLLVRHVLWALPDPEAVLSRWAALVRPGGRLILVEGRWGESAPTGIAATELRAMLSSLPDVPAAAIRHEDLTDDPALWGRPVRDERYALIARTMTA